jgi:hypothetical protein
MPHFPVFLIQITRWKFVHVYTYIISVSVQLTNSANYQLFISILFLTIERISWRRLRLILLVLWHEYAFS